MWYPEPWESFGNGEDFSSVLILIGIIIIGIFLYSYLKRRFENKFWNNPASDLDPPDINQKELSKKTPQDREEAFKEILQHKKSI